MDDLLRDMAADRKRDGQTARPPWAPAGEVHRERRRHAEKLVNLGYAKWGNPQRTLLLITEPGRRYLEDKGSST